MQIDVGQLTNGEIEDMEEYAGRPVMGPINRAFQEATTERLVKGVDPKNGTPLEETVYDIDEQVLLDLLPSKVLVALNCVTKRRKDPTFTIDKWRDAQFGPNSDEVRALLDPPPTGASASKSRRSVRLSAVNSPNSEKNGSSSTPPSATSTPATPLRAAGSSRKRSTPR
jgi:hypothetical protein